MIISESFMMFAGENTNFNKRLHNDWTIITRIKCDSVNWENVSIASIRSIWNNEN